MDIGFVVIHRKILEWEWYQDTNVKILFLHCIFKANYTKKKWKGYEIDRGEFITSLDTLSNELGLSKQQIRTAFTKLESTNEITRKSTNKNTMVKVLNYDIYQDKDYYKNKQDNTQDNTQITNEQHSNNIQITPTNNINKENNENKDNKTKIQDTQEYKDFVTWFMKNYKSKKNKKNRELKLPTIFKKHDVEELKRAVERYMKETEDDDPKFIKHESTWWNGGYIDYLDENYEEIKPNNNKKPKTQNYKTNQDTIDRLEKLGL